MANALFGYLQAVLLPKPRGALSARLFESMQAGTIEGGSVTAGGPESADDAHIALWCLYELHYRGFDDLDDDLEWMPQLLAARAELERAFEADLRRRFESPQSMSPFAQALTEYIASHDGRSIATFVQRDASLDQTLDLLRMRTIYHLRESDPSAWVVPRLRGRPQAALMELQYDEYGAGDPNRSHAHLFAKGIAACGLDPQYGAYIDEAPVEVLEQNNAMTLFGLHRRLRGAALGHLAAFEATSSLPCRRMSQGLARLGLPQEMIEYYDEHVEADAVHEQLAVRTICGSLVQDEPRLTADFFLGAFTCLDLEDRFAGYVLDLGQAA